MSVPPSPTTLTAADEDWRYFVHGTTTSLWRAATAIEPRRGGGDFGAGFYTYEDTAWGRLAAWAWADRKVGDHGGHPMLVRVKMQTAILKALDREDVLDATLDAYYRRYYRDSLSGRELMVGPVGQNAVTGERVPIRRLPRQYKFEGTGISKLLIDSLIRRR